jgi:hypothetical protein
LRQHAIPGVFPHKIKQTPLAACFRCGRCPGDGAKRPKVLRAKSAVEEKNAMHVPKGRVIRVMHSCDKEERSGEMLLKRTEGAAGEALQIHVVAGILTPWIEVDHDFVKDGAGRRLIDQGIEALLVRLALGVEERPGEALTVSARPVGDVAQVRLQLWPAS